MELYLIRHADALDIGERGITNDEERPLSEEGEAQSRALAAALQQRGVVLDTLFTSPLVRARLTAELLLQTWVRPELILETCDALAPGSKLRKLRKYLVKQGGDRVGLVGHMPHLGHVAAWLLGDKRMQIDIAKAGVVMLSCDDVPDKGLGTLRWMVSPEWY